MPDLSFHISGAVPVDFAATPTLALKLHISNNPPEEQIRNILLQCQIQIEATRRSYSDDEKALLMDLYGAPERWNQTLRSSLWTNTTVNVPPFAAEIDVDLPVLCSFDFNVAATKYFYALESGEVPLCVMFSGTCFFDDPVRGFSAAQIPWSLEARYRLPVSVWKAVIDRYYPNTAWLTLRRDVFDRLHEFKMRNSIPTWDLALEKLLS